MTLPSSPERAEIRSLLADLTASVEELLSTGLAAASEKTRQTLAVSFQAASGKRLLRLGSTLRVAVEELGRYANNDPGFSRRRYSFFLNRAWMLSRGMAHALERNDERQWDKLTWRPGGRAVSELSLVTLGVTRRVVPNAFVAFEFRQRVVGNDGGLEDGTPVTWSTIFPLRAEADVPPEAYLHLPQPQKFKASEFLPGPIVRVQRAQLTEDGRLTLQPDSTVETGETFADWERFLSWSPERALERVRAHEPSPFDLEVELQEEVVLPEWQLGEPEDDPREERVLYPIETPVLAFHASLDRSADGGALRAALTEWGRKKRRPPLFGILHYEMCRFVLQPLTVFPASGPETLTLSKQNFDPATLVRVLKYT